jgi:hypothetical protein
MRLSDPIESSGIRLRQRLFMKAALLVTDTPDRSITRYGSMTRGKVDA